MAAVQKQVGGWLLFCGGLVLTLVSALTFLPAMQGALHEPQALGLDEHLSNVKVEQATWLLKSDGGRWGRYGWYLGPKEQGHLRIRLPFEHEGVLKFRIWSYSAGTLAAKLVEGSEGHDISPAELDGRIIHMTMHGPCELVIMASSELSEEQLVLDRFAVAWAAPSDLLPSLIPLVSGLGVSVFGWLLIGGYVSMAAWHQWTGVVAIFLAMIVGIAQRWELLDLARGLPVDPDVLSYMAYAKSFDWFSGSHGFYSGTFGEREPMFVALLDTWFHIWGETFPTMRFFTVMASVLLVPITGLIIWRIGNNTLLAALAAWVLAAHPVWIEESVRGLRLEVLTMLLLMCINIWLTARGWSGAVALGGVVGALGLTQAPLLTVMLGICWFGWVVACSIAWRDKAAFHHWQWGHLVVASIVATMLFLPHLYGLYTLYGDPTQPSKGYARWNANFEFPERIGTPGFPTAQEFARNPYAGPPLSYGEYLFGLHSIPTLLKGQIKGWLESSIYMSTSITPEINKLIYLFHASGIKAVMRHVTLGTVVVSTISLGLTLLGWLQLWRNPKLWWVPFLSLWGTWYVAYLYSVRLVEPFRHTAHVYPLVLFCLLWPTYRVWVWLRRRQQSGCAHLSILRSKLLPE